MMTSVRGRPGACVGLRDGEGGVPDGPRAGRARRSMPIRRSLGESGSRTRRVRGSLRGFSIKAAGDGTGFPTGCPFRRWQAAARRRGMLAPCKRTIEPARAPCATARRGARGRSRAESRRLHCIRRVPRVTRSRMSVAHRASDVGAALFGFNSTHPRILPPLTREHSPKSRHFIAVLPGMPGCPRSASDKSSGCRLLSA